MTSRGARATQIPFGNDKQRSKSNCRSLRDDKQKRTQIPYGNDKQRSKAKAVLLDEFCSIPSLGKVGEFVCNGT